MQKLRSSKLKEPACGKANWQERRKQIIEYVTKRPRGSWAVLDKVLCGIKRQSLSVVLQSEGLGVRGLGKENYIIAPRRAKKFGYHKTSPGVKEKIEKLILSGKKNAREIAELCDVSVRVVYLNSKTSDKKLPRAPWKKGNPSPKVMQYFIQNKAGNWSTFLSWYEQNVSSKGMTYKRAKFMVYRESDTYTLECDVDKVGVDSATYYLRIKNTVKNKQESNNGSTNNSTNTKP